MNNDQQIARFISDSDAFSLIRVETALSRYPIHRLANKGTISINIRKNDEKGSAILRWEVDYSNKQGQPGPLAYKLDTRIVNRRIEEQARPLPKLLRLGSLHEIAQELELGRNTLAVRKALLQNVGAIINAKIVYKAVDKTERTLEAAFNRYSVIFTGETLPDGRKADAVFLLFNDIYLEVLNSATRRPMDYDYLCELAPGPQRFYEILSYEMLPAIKYNQRAKLPYSEFCMYSTMTRYFEFEQVKKQMYKIHQPHIKAGYIAQKVEYEATVDGDGKPDWNMFYTPSEKAKFQQLVFSFAIPLVSRKQAKSLSAVRTAQPAQAVTDPPVPVLPFIEDAMENNQSKDLVRKFHQLRYGREQEPTERELGEARSYLADGEAWAIHLIEFAAHQGKEKNGFPNDFGGVKKLIAQAREPFDAKRKERDAVAAKMARQSHQEAHTAAYHAFLGELLGGRLESSLPEAFTAFTEQEQKTHRFYKGRAEKADASERTKQDAASFYDEDRRVKRLLDFIEKTPKCGIPEFWQWDAKMNPNRFQPAG